jgi:hypothetical protein
MKRQAMITDLVWMARGGAALALASLFLAGCQTSRPPLARAAPGPVVTLEMNVPFQIGDATVHAQVFQRQQSWPTFLNVHDDENTAVAAGRAHVVQFGGRLIELVHSGKRHVTFRLDGAEHAFDPNRIFSDAGIAATLRRQGAYSAAAHQAVSKFASDLLKEFALDREAVIIALHNTGQGSYSIHSYLPGGEHAAAAAAIHVSPKRSRHDFFYVTDRRLFDALTAKDFNVILQDNERVPDDGSMSVYFARQGIPYVNVEAREGYREEQVEMLRALRGIRLK